MTTQSSASQSSTPLDSTSSNSDQAMPQDQQPETRSNDGLHKVETARETIAKSKEGAESPAASAMSSNTTSTSNVALTNDSDWDLLLTALIAKESTPSRQQRISQALRIFRESRSSSLRTLVLRPHRQNETVESQDDDRLASILRKE